MIIRVKVITKASCNQIIGFEQGTLKIKCTVPPEKGKANDKIIELLSKYYKVSKSNIIIIKGESSSLKIIEIKGI